MSSRATRNVCIFCQNAVSSSRNSTRLAAPIRQLSTVQSTDNALPPGSSQAPHIQLERTLQHQISLFSPVDMLKEALSPPKKLQGDIQGHTRTPITPGLLQLPRNPPLITPVEAVKHAANNPTPQQLKLWPTLTMDEFREALGRKAIRRVIRKQLQACQNPRDILRVVAVALQRPETTLQLRHLYHALTIALFNARNGAPDTAILATLNAIISRFRLGNIPVADELIVLGLKFAARTRSLPAMKRYLKETKDRGIMTKNLFRSVIAKCSIGSRGLGEIRNGKWRKRELVQVLTGFPNTPPEEACHLGSFVRRDEWSFVHGWITILARCRLMHLLEEEWRLWLEHPLRTSPRQLSKTEIEEVEKEDQLNAYLMSNDENQGSEDVDAIPESDIESLSHVESASDLESLPQHQLEPSNTNPDTAVNVRFTNRTTRTRGDRLFVEQLMHAGDAQSAWRVLKESGLPWGDLERSARSRMLEHVEHATVWNDELREAMKQKYLEDLRSIEKALGVRWVADGSEGYHVLIGDTEEALERLSEMRIDPRHGFPLEGDEDVT